MLSKINAIFYDYVEDLVRRIPNDTVLGSTVRDYVNGNTRKNKPNKQKEQIVYTFKVTY